MRHGELAPDERCPTHGPHQSKDTPECLVGSEKLDNNLRAWSSSNFHIF